MTAKVQATGLRLTCECKRVHLIRSFGKREGHWRCQCGGSIHWKFKGEAEMLIPPNKKKQKDNIMDIFERRKK